MIIIFFYFPSSFATQFSLFVIWMTQEISQQEIGNDRYLGMANYNIYFKNNFNRLVINITQKNFLKCAYMKLS